MAQKLPPSLLELTMLRIGGMHSARFSAQAAMWQRALMVRRMHQAAHHQPAPFDEFLEAGLPSYNTQRPGRRASPSMAIRTQDNESAQLSNPTQELERRVSQLEQTIKEQDPSISALAYSEAELLAFYEDVLANPDPKRDFPEVSPEELLAKQKEEDLQIVASIAERLHDLPSSDVFENASVNRKILFRAHEMVSEMERSRKDLGLESHGQPLLPTPVLTTRECHALVRTSVEEGDARAAELALQIMKRTNLPLPDGAVTDILRLHASKGDAHAADQLLATYLTDTPTEDQRHYHVKAHLTHEALAPLPLSAMKLIHEYESQGVPAPMKTYTNTITTLFSRETALSRATAWDMFAHMRYAAHPDPDQLLYTLMIRACASPVSSKYTSEPEKALDLWTEMTVDHKIPPSVGSYNAIILACARSGRKEYVNEAFRLSRQMLDSHRDAYGVSAFRPDKKTFCALLDGVKRIGDLARARWILAEMVKGPDGGADAAVDERGKEADLEADEEVMSHMFHAYAAYKPPFVRSATKIIDRTSTESSSPSEDRTDVAAVEEEDGPAPSFAVVPPQSKSEVVREARFLFERILDAQPTSPSLSSSVDDSPLSLQAFRGVRLTTRLLNSYLSVHYRHGDLNTARELFWKLFEDHGVQRTARSFVEALERCAISSKAGDERKVAAEFAKELWAKWDVIEKDGMLDGQRLPARYVERMHRAMVKVLAITDDLEGAMTHLRHFASLYPPQNVRTPPKKLPVQSTRTSLEGDRPLVRMTSSAELPDDHVPPLMMFRDLEALHHRLVEEEREKDIKYVTWLCKAYEWALRNRRNDAIRAPVRESRSRVDERKGIEFGHEARMIED